MQQVNDSPTAVCWRIKQNNLNWLRETAQQQERPVTWLINKLIEQAKKEQETNHANAV